MVTKIEPEKEKEQVVNVILLEANRVAGAQCVTVNATGCGYDSHWGNEIFKFMISSLWWQSAACEFRQSIWRKVGNELS